MSTKKATSVHAIYEVKKLTQGQSMELCEYICGRYPLMGNLLDACDNQSDEYKDIISDLVGHAEYAQAIQNQFGDMVEAITKHYKIESPTN